MPNHDEWLKKRKKGLKLVSNSLHVQQAELLQKGIDVSREVKLIDHLLFEIVVKL